MKNLAIALTAVLSVTTLAFLASVFTKGFYRSLARTIRKTSLARLARPDYSIWELLLWARKTSDAMLQLTKAYDWRVLQWSGLATVVLTATLAFVSAIVVEYFKTTITINSGLKLWFTLLGIWASLLVYLIAQRRITLLKNQFMSLYTLLRRLA